MMKDRILLQHIIDTSEITVAKQKEATKYLARLEAIVVVAEDMAERLRVNKDIAEKSGWHNADLMFTLEDVEVLTSYESLQTNKLIGRINNEQKK